MYITFPKGKIGVAVSGGIDSMVLLHSLMRKNADVLVVNIEHGIRGAESQQDSEFVISYCNKNKLECLSFSVDAIKVSKQRKISVELAARLLRYEIFNQLLQEKKVDHIALGHHADDNAETILMRILRGTGIRGLKGICDYGRFIHPLINYSRQQIEDYAFKNRIPCTLDSSNLEDEYTRNFLRNNILRILRERFPSMHESFGRLAGNAQEADDYIMLNTLKIYQTENGYSLKLDEFITAHSIIKKYTLMNVFNKMGVFQDIEARHYEYINLLIDMKNNSTINLPFEIIAIKEYDQIIFTKAEALKVEEFYQQLDWNKQYIFCGERYSFIKGSKICKGISFDADKVPSSAVIRTRLDGDVFKRYGGGTKKLNDYLTDIKMSKRQREKLLVIADGNNVLMICGIEVSDSIKIGGNTKEILYIKKERL